ncbi:hypothetical protein E8P77_26865 [Soehngenia saccharolytica]|nr:hypothetical protein E8P77_26865 [Soehngenia saccharolytica]
MSQYNQNQPQVAYPPPPSTAAPPPLGYPRRDGQTQPQNHPPASEATKYREDGFWKGCCAALCCCCMLDDCF